MIPLKILALTVSLAAGTAQAQSYPGDVTEVTEGLIAVGMAVELSDKCDGVSARRLRGINLLFGLKNTLQSAGFSDAQIDAYIDDRAEKDRLEGIARGRLADLGVNTSDPASYCAVARAQMAQGTQVGQLLR